MNDHIVVDCRGMQCPAPILEIAKTARKVASKPTVLEILADDDDFPTDLEAWCRSAKAQLQSLDASGGAHRALVSLNGAAARPASEAASGAPARSQPPAPPLRSSPGARRTTQTRDLGRVRAQEATPAVPRRSSRVSTPPPAPAAAPRVPSARPVANPTSSRRPSVLDLRGQRAPAPVVCLSGALGERQGETVDVLADDPAFMTDVVVWASSARVEVQSLDKSQGVTRARLRFPGGRSPAPAPSVDDLAFDGPPSNGALVPAGQPAVPTGVQLKNKCTILVLRNDFEGLMAALLTANGARAQGMETVIYFSFWGVNVLRGERPRQDMPKQKVSLLQRIMKWMMPKGPHRQKMSKMHMGGAGLGMMQMFMRKNNVLGLAQLMDEAVDSGVRFLVCTMSMGIMGIQKRDLMDLPNLEFGGVTSFVEEARDSRMSLVF